MKNEIRSHLNDPGQLEKLYRNNKAPFAQEFRAIYPELKGNLLADFWHERLNYESDDISWGTGRDLLLVLLASLVAGIVAKLPAFLPIDEEFFYPRNIGFIVFPLLTAYFAWKNNLKTNRIVLLAATIVVSLVYINLLPGTLETDTLVLACLHLPFLLWGILGVAYTGNEINNHSRRLGYLRFNGDLLVMTALLVIAGVILTGITIALFAIIGIHIEQFYAEYIAVFGAAAIPIVATYLTQTNPHLVNKVSPVIAKIFSPLVLIMLSVYLIATPFSGKDPYNDREFLILFNVLLIGVMALIFFSIADKSGKEQNTTDSWVLLLLAIVTVIVNSIALSAILFRIAEWGLTPNRLAVLGSNVLILLNLLLVTRSLFRSVTKKADVAELGKAIATYLPVYFIWILIVVFLFPVLFGFR
ncbi:hypothetical protein JAO76_12570 [Pontibacter sp. BT310]|uniref:DUF4153 domain-containing protein n=1 Tax=Pontibacter populi TaxID=890055 RepID=A0ABS6XD07_9BACT|nr:MULTISPECIES: hypothetical protein [Pontibacter]MBJ6119033.1 hypothetical protein [Pontibacter sp. BT310]MBR0571461.1 hypothetical protein [Microvirga sp. STS03]MBW3365887.1 hypothetical protein [Pontibacter populi]